MNSIELGWRAAKVIRSCIRRREWVEGGVKPEKGRRGTE